LRAGAFQSSPLRDSLVKAIQGGLEAAAETAMHSWGVYCVVRDSMSYGDGAYMPLAASLCRRLEGGGGAESLELWLGAVAEVADAEGLVVLSRHEEAVERLDRACLSLEACRSRQNGEFGFQRRYVGLRRDTLETIGIIESLLQECPEPSLADPKQTHPLAVRLQRCIEADLSPLCEAWAGLQRGHVNTGTKSGATLDRIRQALCLCRDAAELTATIGGSPGKWVGFRGDCGASVSLKERTRLGKWGRKLEAEGLTREEDTLQGWACRPATLLVPFVCL